MFQPIVYKWFAFENKWADKLWGLCSVSIAAQVITFPLSAFYFHQFPVYFLISNLLIVVPTEIIMITGIAYLLLPQIPYLSKALAFVLEWSILIMNKFLTWIEYLPFASISKIWLTAAEYILLYGIIIGLFCFLFDRKAWLIKVCLCCIFVLCISISLKAIRQAGTRSMAFLNLNKHKAIVFKNGNSAVIVSDIKLADKAWQYSIQPYLDSIQINNINLLSINQNIKTSWIQKQDGLIQFLNHRVYLFGGQPDDVTLSPQLKTDYLYVTNNPHTTLTNINHNFDYQLLIIDGSNSNAYTQQLTDEAQKNKINYKSLKRNNSLITVSN